MSKTMFSIIILVSLLLGCSADVDEKMPQIETYQMNLSSNAANLSMFTSDGQFVYYINYNDGCKLYKINENGSGNQIIANNSFIKIFHYNGVIYFTERLNNNSSGAFSCINTDGTGYKVLIDEEVDNISIWNFIIYEDNIYAIGDKGDVEPDAGFSLGYLMSINIDSMEITILDNENSGYIMGDFVICEDKIYYRMNHTKFMYDISSKEIKEVPIIGSQLQEIDGNVYSVDMNKIYKFDVNNFQNNIIYQDDKGLEIRSLYVTNTGIIFSTKESNTLNVFKMNHDGSDLLEICSIPYLNFRQEKQDILYVINDKIFIVNIFVVENKSFLIVVDLKENKFWSL